jgi:hypothetical protein
MARALIRVGRRGRYALTVEDKHEILRGVPLFADLDERGLQAVSILAREVTLKSGDVLRRRRRGWPGRAGADLGCHF